MRPETRLRLVRVATISTFATLLAVGVPASAEIQAQERLAQIKARVADNLSRQPDYTCLQTIERSQRAARSKRFKTLDTLRLEVALIQGKEMFSWPGADQIETEDIRELVPEGAVGRGSFALHARNVFLSPAAEHSYAGLEKCSGKPCFRYDYAVPLPGSSYLVRTGSGEAMMAVRGSFWAEADTLDVVRLEVNADGIPPELALRSISDVMEYARVPFGESSFLLPARALSTGVQQDGRAVRNEIEYSGCRQYAGTSVLSFGAPPTVEPEPVVVPPTVLELPARLRMELALQTPIDEERTKVGDRVIAVVQRSVRREGRVVAPKGAEVTGRVLRFERSPERKGYHTVAIELDSLAFDNTRAVLAAELIGFKSRFREGLMVRLDEGRTGLQTGLGFQEQGNAGGGVFRVRVRMGKMVIPRGTVLVWRTVR